MMLKCQKSKREGRTTALHKGIIRPVLVYGAETLTVTRREEGLLERSEMRMLRWILGVSLKDKKRNEVIRKTLGWHALLRNTSWR